jgi:hypothetical protein
MAHLAVVAVTNDDSQQSQPSLRRQKSNLFPDRFLTFHVYIGFSRANLLLPAIFFSSTSLNGLYEPCEFENKRLLAFVDDPDFGTEDVGYFDRGKLRDKPKLVEQPFLLA